MVEAVWILVAVTCLAVGILIGVLKSVSINVKVEMTKAEDKVDPDLWSGVVGSPEHIKFMARAKAKENDNESDDL